MLQYWDVNKGHRMFIEYNKNCKVKQIKYYPYQFLKSIENDSNSNFKILDKNNISKKIVKCQKIKYNKLSKDMQYLRIFFETDKETQIKTEKIEQNHNTGINEKVEVISISGHANSKAIVLEEFIL